MWDIGAPFIAVREALPIHRLSEQTFCDHLSLQQHNRMLVFDLGNHFQNHFGGEFKKRHLVKREGAVWRRSANGVFTTATEV